MNLKGAWFALFLVLAVCVQTAFSQKACYDCDLASIINGDGSEIIEGRTTYAYAYITETAVENWSILNSALFIYDFEDTTDSYSDSELATDRQMRDILAMAPPYQLVLERNVFHYQQAEGKVRSFHGTVYNGASTIKIPPGAKICIPDRYYTAIVEPKTMLKLKNGTECEGMRGNMSGKYCISDENAYIVRCKNDGTAFDLVRRISKENKRIGCGQAFGILRMNESTEGYDILCSQQIVDCYRGYASEKDEQNTCNGLASKGAGLQYAEAAPERKMGEPASALKEDKTVAQKISQTLQGAYKWARKLIDPSYCEIETDCARGEHCVRSTGCVKSSSCILIQGNKNDSKRINLLFVGDGFENDTEFDNIIRQIVDYEGNRQGMMSLQPYARDRDRFNIFMRRSNQTIQINQSPELEKIDENAVKNQAALCPRMDYYVLISRQNFRARAHMGGPDAYVSLTYEDSEWWGHTVAHELGHSIGRLQDEYVEPELGDWPGWPNCAPDNQTARQWWGSTARTGNFSGCSYTPENVRPTFNSMMRDHRQNKDGFGPVSEQYFQVAIENKAGEKR